MQYHFGNEYALGILFTHLLLSRTIVHSSSCVKYCWNTSNEDENCWTYWRGKFVDVEWNCFLVPCCRQSGDEWR